MIFHGVGKRFDTRGGAQYDAIGCFWDAMAKQYGRENLCGLGWDWNEESLAYAIGSIEPGIEVEMEGMTEFTVELPSDGQQTWHGQTEQLDMLYEQIYADGALEYEIERFYEDRRCSVDIWRKK